MSANSLEVVRWTPALDSACDEPGFLNRIDTRWEALRVGLVAIFLAVVVIGGAASIVIEGSSALRGDDLSSQERANVMIATRLAGDVFNNGDLTWLDRSVAS